MEIWVYAGTSERVLHCASGENLLSVLQRNGYHITAPCGGTGRCGKCRVRILAGQAEGEKDGYVIACRTTVTEDLTVEVQEATGGGLTASGGAVGGTDGEAGYGVALDIGTTTLAFSLVNLRSGEEPAREGFLNRQGVYGADVISRIVSAGEGHLQEMQSCILQQTREVLRDFIARYHTGPLRRLSVCGNTTMLHLFLGADVDGIGKVGSVTPNNGFFDLSIELNPRESRYVVKKGSIAINGVSLTVANISGNAIKIAVIPHTFRNTCLRELKSGNYVNIEVDILAKYVEKFLSTSDNKSRIDMDFLKRNGFY